MPCSFVASCGLTLGIEAHGGQGPALHLRRVLAPLVSTDAEEVEVRLRVSPLPPEQLAERRLFLVSGKEGLRAAFWRSRLELEMGRPARAHIQVEEGNEAALLLALENLLYLVAPGLGALLLHAAAVALDGRALLFVGPSDAGKTTCCRNAPAEARILSDEAVVCRHVDGRWTAHATPFCSAGFAFELLEGYWPLQTLFLLRRGTPLVAPASPAEALRSVMRAGAKLGSEEATRALDLAAELVSAVPALCLRTDHPAQVWPAALGLK